MTRNADKLLTDLITEIQLLRVEVGRVLIELERAKLEVVLTVRGTTKRRKRRRRVDPSGLIV